MINSDNDSKGKRSLPPGGDVLSIEQTIGDIVVELIREGHIITRQRLCVAVAARIHKNTPPVLEAHYADILRLLLTRQLD